MSIRTALFCALSLLLLAAPAAAQQAVDPSTAQSFTQVAPASAMAYETAPVPAGPGVVSAFPRTDRHGRVLAGTRHETQSDRGLWGAGLGLFIGGWVLDIVGTAIFNAVSDDRDGALEEDAMAWSIVPFVGPIVQLALQAPHPALPLTSGLMQIGGLVLFCLGITSQHDVEIPIYGYADAGSPSMTLGFDARPMGDGGYASVTLHTM